MTETSRRRRPTEDGALLATQPYWRWGYLPLLWSLVVPTTITSREHCLNLLMMQLAAMEMFNYIVSTSFSSFYSEKLLFAIYWSIILDKHHRSLIAKVGICFFKICWIFLLNITILWNINQIEIHSKGLWWWFHSAKIIEMFHHNFVVFRHSLRIDLI